MSAPVRISTAHSTAEADRKLTRNFMLSEFLASDTAAREGIDNSPTADDLANIEVYLAPGAQSIRDILGSAVLISSGYRSRALNAATRGSGMSQHMRGLAIDFRAPGYGTPRQIATKLAEHMDDLGIDQLILEGVTKSPGSPGVWVHVSFDANPRGQIMSAILKAGQNPVYVKGIY